MTELGKSCRHSGTGWSATDHGDIDIVAEHAGGVGGAQGSSSPTNDTPAADSRAYAPRQ